MLSSSRYIIGIDLGTTNTTLSYIDTHKKNFNSVYPVQLWPAPQLVDLGVIKSEPMLPSCCYIARNNELPFGGTSLPWIKEQSYIVGELARILGEKNPYQCVESAKSWLCYGQAYRNEKILPIKGPDTERISPLEASVRYITHLCKAWNHTMSKGNITEEMEQQQVVLTVPASFDEVARHLTVEAAKQAGLQYITLLEEPQAAFYNWLHRSSTPWQELFKESDQVLIVDVGGGTTDFSLIQAVKLDQEISLQRMAVGRHLLLGGDNIDLAITHYLEDKLKKEGIEELSDLQWAQLKHKARKAKEDLLGNNDSKLQSYSVIIQGTGSRVVLGSIQINITKHELQELILKGFWDLLPWTEAIQVRKSTGLQTVGLPYEAEPSIIKHLANFLQKNIGEEPLSKPKYILFNGGTMKPILFQRAVIEALDLWYPGPTPITLNKQDDLDFAVAKGASSFGLSKRGIGTSVGGGTPRSYYLKMEIAGKKQPMAMAVIPRGSSFGFQYLVSHEFYVKPNTPVAFQILYSHSRIEDALESLVEIDEENFAPLPPIQTVLRYGKRNLFEDTKELIPVKLQISLTEIGIIEVWLQSCLTDHRWQLEFHPSAESSRALATATEETFTPEELDDFRKLIVNRFQEGKEGLNSLMKDLESLIGKGRNEWGVHLLRGLWPAVLAVSDKRKVAAHYAVRWWNLTGFILRPGFGYPLDEHRIKDLWRLILQEEHFKTTSQEVYLQQLICYRRIAGGLNRGQQQQVANSIIPQIWNKSSKSLIVPQRNDYNLYSELLRTVVSMEWLDVSFKITLGKALLERIVKKIAQPAEYWAVGRLGTRVLMHASISYIIPKEDCTAWVDQLLEIYLNDPEKEIEYLIATLARKTPYREVNLSEKFIEQLLDKLPYDFRKQIEESLIDIKEVSQVEREQALGDTLPLGLQLKLNQ
ncbi:MAG: dnak3 [Chlamydiales bacterium]|jgi:hypothetical protein|nr:dnak3 [Chlamydiales bacterium]